MKTTFIYALCEPETRTVRYIGKADSPKKRLISHLNTSAKTETHLGRWLRSLVSVGKTPALIVLAEVSRGCWQEEEIRYIRAARALGLGLTNGTDGGDGGLNPLPEARKRMSERQTGSGNHMFGRTGENSPIFGHACAPETRKKIGDKNRGEKSAMFGRSGDKSPTFGRKRPKRETDAMSRRRKGVPLSPEHCEALSKAQIGRKHSEETKAKQSAARAASWARRKVRDQEIEWALAPHTLE